MEDAPLLGKALKGDGAAFATLYDRHAGAVFAYAYRLVGERTAAEDVAQETFLALFRGRSFDPSRSFRAWLLTLTRNEAFDLLRKRKVRKEVGAQSEFLDSIPAPRTERDDGEDVHKALRAIPQEYREALWLCDGMGMSYQEASEVMGCDVGTVGSRLSRGRRLLREHFVRNGHAV